jgi:hypothetical protein
MYWIRRPTLCPLCPARPNHTPATSTPSSHVRANETSSHFRAEQRAPRQFEREGRNLQANLLGARPNHNFSPINASQPALPSIYTTPPYSTVFNQPDGSPNQPAEELDNQRSLKRRRLGPSDQSPRSLPPADPSVSPIPERDIIQYVDM